MEKNRCDNIYIYVNGQYSYNLIIMPMGVLEHELFYNPFFLHSFKTETLQLFIIKFLIGCPKG